MARVKVRYVGFSDTRTITPSDVKPFGVSLDNKLVWSRFNGFALNLDVTPEFEAVLRDQGHFTISVLTDNDAEGEVVAVATNPDKVESVVASEEGKATQKSKVN